MKVIQRMGTYAPGTQPQRPQKLLPGPRGNRGIVDNDKVKTAAEYLASVNLSKEETWKYPLQVFPRAKGRATHVIYTTYDLARPEAMPHDVIYLNGKVYYSDFGSQYIGEMDPKTGKITDHAVPVLKPEEPKGVLELKPDLPHARPRRGHFDQNGILWYAEYGSNAVGRFDPKTGKITEWQMPVKWQMPYDALANKKGDVYTGSMLSDRIVRLDPKTSQF